MTYGIGLVAVSGFLWIIYQVSQGTAIGGGDVKLMGAAGLLLGWQNAIVAFLLGCIVASVIHLIRMKVSNAEHKLAMGPYLSVGIFMAALWGSQFLNWYLSLFIISK